MKLLLTSSGISNPSLRAALVEMLGKPIEEANALFVPTGIYPFSVGPRMAYRAICGQAKTPLAELGWASLGVLELTALSSIAREAWVPSVEETDALLVWGGDPVFLSYWMRESGLAEMLRYREGGVYVGVSAGSMATAGEFAESYSHPPGGPFRGISSEPIEFETQKGKIRNTLVKAQGAGLVDFAVIPHLDHEEHPDASMTNAEQWAATMSVPVYAIDDQSGVKVVDGKVQVVSEGHWRLFE